MEKVYQMYRVMYWSQIFNRKTSFSVKRLAMRSLWIMRNFNSKSNVEREPRFTRRPRRVKRSVPRSGSASYGI